MRLQAYLNERLVAIAYAMLEGVLDEDDEQQRRQQAIGQYLRHVERDAYIVRIAHRHKPDIVVQELNLARQWCEPVVSLIQYVSHQFRQLDNRCLGTFGVDVDKSVYVVERIHQEVRIDLILKVLQLPFEGVLLYLR